MSPCFELKRESQLIRCHGRRTQKTAEPNGRSSFKGQTADARVTERESTSTNQTQGKRSGALVERGDVVEIRNDILLGILQNNSLLNVGGAERTE